MILLPSCIWRKQAFSRHFFLLTPQGTTCLLFILLYQKGGPFEVLVPSIDLDHCPLHPRSSHISGHTRNPGVLGTRVSSHHSHSSPLTDTSGRITLFTTSLVPYILGPYSLLTSTLLPIYWTLLTPFSPPRLGLKTTHQHLQLLIFTWSKA